jgi:hypothetical protein
MKIPMRLPPLLTFSGDVSHSFEKCCICTYQCARPLGYLLANVVVKKHPRFNNIDRLKLSYRGTPRTKPFGWAILQAREDWDLESQ